MQQAVPVAPEASVVVQRSPAERPPVERDPSQITMKSLLEAGVHFGHQKRRWNPKMRRYIFTHRNGIHIIDLQKTLRMLEEAASFISEVAADGKKVLMVGTKKQAAGYHHHRIPARQRLLHHHPLAGRNAHQLQDHPVPHRLPSRPRDAQGEGRIRDPAQKRSAQAGRLHIPPKPLSGRHQRR